MRIHILYQFSNGPYGGGNQFLKALREAFERERIYENDARNADVILLNGYHHLLQGVWKKVMRPRLTLVHRLGPIFHLHRGGNWKFLDRLVIRAANTMADMVVFQSAWTQKQSLQLGFHPEVPHTVIHNAPDPKIFHPAEKTVNPSGKIRLLISSWSANKNKGFSFYAFLDEHLDFAKYDCTFIGNAPIKFKHITKRLPLPSDQLAEALREHDIFISAVKDDACSNSIIEALACGLPVIALHSGGNAELVGAGGELFTTASELIPAIDRVSQDIEAYRQKVSVISIDATAQSFLRAIQSGQTKPRKRHTALMLFSFCFMGISLGFFVLYTKIRSFLRISSS